MAAPRGNTNASKTQRLWADMLERKVVQDPNRLERIALKVLQAAEDGEPWAVTELGNRLDGKPVQPVDMKTTTDTPTLTNAMLAHVVAGGKLDEFEREWTLQ